MEDLLLKNLTLSALLLSLSVTITETRVSVASLSMSLFNHDVGLRGEGNT